MTGDKRNRKTKEGRYANNFNYNNLTSIHKKVLLYFLGNTTK